MTTEPTIHDLQNEGRILALDMLLRIIYSEIASQMPNPNEWMTGKIEQTCASMDLKSLDTENAIIVVDKAQDYLRSFGENFAYRVQSK